MNSKEVFEIESIPYTLANIIKMAGISERTARRHLKDGILKGHKVGGSWRFTEENIRDYFNDKTMIDNIAKEAGQDVRAFLKKDYTSEDDRICSIIDFRPENKDIENRARQSVLDLSNAYTDISMKYAKHDGVMRFTLTGSFDYILACTESLNKLRS